MSFPKEFIDSLPLDNLEQQELLSALSSESPISIRFNPYKVSSPPELEKVPWSRYGFYLPERPSFTLDPLFHAGTYYVQEASSMFLEHILNGLEPEGKRILDLCAAPGGKTTLLSTMVGLEGHIVANEVVYNRALALKDNAIKWGLGNITVTSNQPSHFSSFINYFDIIVVDAPCSGEGMFRKDKNAVDEWSPKNVVGCANRQREILSNVWNSLKPGGHLIYSTCTFNELENEENVRWLAENYDYEGTTIDCPDQWGVQCGAIDGIPTFRFWPHMVKGEGFFAAVITKSTGHGRVKVHKKRPPVISPCDRKTQKIISGYVNQPEFLMPYCINDDIYFSYEAAYKDIIDISETLSVVYSGVRAGRLYGNSFKPDHPLALFHDINTELTGLTDLDQEQALDFLRRTGTDYSLYKEGINLVSYEGFPLGWAKRTGQKVNNMVPKEFAIKNL